jgi:hypothetical protein
MKTLLPLLAVALGLSGSPVLGHVVPGQAPHLHAGDGWGLAVVAALTVLAIWLGGRFRK